MSNAEVESRRQARNSPEAAGELNLPVDVPPPRRSYGRGIDLYHKHRQAIHRYASTWLRSPHDAEDIVQEVMLRAWRALPGFERRGDASERAWLFAIARHCVIDELRRRSRVAPHDPHRLAAISAWGGSQRAHLDASATEDGLRASIAWLPIGQRQVVFLRYELSLTTNEMAAVLERSPDAVRHLEHRAMSSLRRRQRPFQGPLCLVGGGHAAPEIRKSPSSRRPPGRSR